MREPSVLSVGTAGGDVQAFDPADDCGEITCDPLWTVSTGAAITGAPAVSDGQLYVGTSDGLVAYGLPTTE